MEAVNGAVPVAQADAPQNEMEIDQDEGPRRIVVDANNPTQEIVNPQRNNYPLEKEKKIKIIKFIAKTHKDILVALKLGAHDTNISLGNQVHNILFTAHTVLRQRNNHTNGTLEARLTGTEYKVMFNNRASTVARETINVMVAANALAAGLPYRRYERNDPQNWYGLAGPILNFLSGFGMRLKELRLGHGSLTYKRVGNREYVIDLRQYGIEGQHHILCEGVTFPPEKKASMAQSLGPLTTLLCYAKSERAYSEKWKLAAKRALSHMPEIDNVLTLVKDKDPSEIRPLIGLLANLCLIATTRQATRMYPPPAAFSKIFLADSTIIEEVTYTKNALLDAFDFSGHGAFCFYKIFQSMKWELNGTMSDEAAKQIVYHCMMGTYKDDLGVLAEITNVRTWKTREQLGGAFRRMNTIGTPVTFTPVEQIYYSKLSGANQTGLLTSNYSQVSSIPAFSGRSKRRFDDAFFEMLDNTNNRNIGGRSLQAMINLYSMTKEELQKILEERGRMLDMGTTGWRKVSMIEANLQKPNEVDFVATATGKFFLGKAD